MVVTEIDEEMVVEMVVKIHLNLIVEEMRVIVLKTGILMEILGVEEEVAPKRDVSPVMAEVVVVVIVYPDLKRDDVNVGSEEEVVTLAPKMDVSQEDPLAEKHLVEPMCRLMVVEH